MKIIFGEYIGEDSRQLRLVVSHKERNDASSSVKFSVVYDFSTEEVIEINVYKASTRRDLLRGVKKLLWEHDWVSGLSLRTQVHTDASIFIVSDDMMSALDNFVYFSALEQMSLARFL